MKAKTKPRITLLAGGVGAARLLRGLARVVEPERLTVVVNTADDDRFYGLHVSPDLDTIVYTLAGLAPVHPGWGLSGESFACLGALERYYGGSWFALGDRDLATHVFRTDRLAAGGSLSDVTREICRAHDVAQRVLPMTDAAVRTVVETPAGTLAFQDYLVRRRARPRVTAVRFRGIRGAHPAPGVLEALEEADAIVLGPSNPFVSIAPILALPGVRRVLRRRRDRVLAVAPLVGGRAVKGPLASMLRSLGHRRGVAGIADYYRRLVGTLFVHPGDRPRRSEAGWPEFVERDIMIARPAAAARLARALVGRIRTEEN